MKKLFSIFILFGVFFSANAQESVVISTQNVISLYANAQKAERVGNYQEAINTYKSILFIDQTQAVPYFKMANLYSANPVNAEEASLAIALYEQFLVLDPNGRNSGAAKSKIEFLQNFMADNGWRQQSHDLAEMIQSGQEQMRDIVMAVVHPAMKAQSKEEIAQYVDETYATFNKAENAYSSGNYQVAEQYFNKVLETADPTSPLYMQTNMLLAEMYGKQGDVQKMQQTLAALEENMTTNKSLTQYYAAKLKDATPFEDDISGVWVSDLTFDIEKSALPYLAIKISKKEEGSYDAKILPYCGLAKKNNMYKGKPFGYYPVINKEVGSDYYAYSYFDTMPHNEAIAFHFTNSKFRRGISEEAVISANKGVNTFTEGLVSVCAEFDNVWIRGGCKVVMYTFGALIKGLIYLFSIDTKKTFHIAADMEQIFPGCLQLRLERTRLVEKSNGYERKSSDNSTMKMYKLYPEYNIVFADKGNELFGHDVFSKEEIQQTEEYEYLNALKEHGYFNRQSYKKLESKVLDYCWAKAEEDPNMKIAAYQSMASFENAKKGLFSYDYDGADGSFHGWVNKSNKKNGKGVLVSNTGNYKYVGSFKNDYMESGKLTVFEGKNVKGEYTGSFKKNQYDGNGVHTAFNIDNGDVLYYYEGAFSKGMRHGQGTLFMNDNSIYSGIWSKGELKYGEGTYDGGIYTGKWKYLKGENKPVPNGKGTLVRDNGETVTGTWKDGVFVPEKKEKKEKVTNQ